MNHQIFRYMQIALAVFFLSFVSTSVWAVEGDGGVKPPTPPQTVICTPQTKEWAAPEPIIFGVIGLIAVFSIVAMQRISNSLSDITNKWSLADALSEEYDITEMKQTLDATGKPLLDAAGKPVLEVVHDTATGKPQLMTEMRASSSRVIALMGMIVILLMFIGFGIFAIHGFAKTGCMPESTQKVIDFLYAGVVLFAPYAINKFSKVFESLSPKKA
jgi:hypothetical protein